MSSRVANILYTGAPLAGVGTSVLYLGLCQGEIVEPYPRYGLTTTTKEGWRLRIHSDYRGPYWFANAVEAIEKCSAPQADGHYRRLKPLHIAHLEFLRVVDGIVFVADSQEARSEANVGRVEKLKSDLDLVGRGLPPPPMVFQCNKRELPNVMTLDEMTERLRWSQSAHVASVARNGEGVVNALKTLLAIIP